MTKVLNPMSVKMAGRPGFGMAARIHHVGRRTGSTYVTPIGAKVIDGMVLIPLTFGNQSDWVRNVRAAAGATLDVRRHAYLMAAPDLVSWADARLIVRNHFPLARFGFKLLGIKQFIYAPVIESELVRPVRLAS